MHDNGSKPNTRRDGLISVCNTWRMRNVTHTMYTQAVQVDINSASIANISQLIEDFELIIQPLLFIVVV